MIRFLILAILLNVGFPLKSGSGYVVVHALKERLVKDVHVLASDSLRGRKFPDIGREKAADYIAGQFAEAGLKGIKHGDEPFFQKIPAKRIDMGETKIYSGGGVYNSGANFSFAATKELDVRQSMPVKFVGYSTDNEIVGYTGKDTLVFFLAYDIIDASMRLEKLTDATGAKYFGFAIHNNKRSLRSSYIAGESLSLIFQERSLANYSYPDGVFGMGVDSEEKWLYDYLPATDNDIGVFLFGDRLFKSFFDEELEDVSGEAWRSKRKNELPQVSDKQLDFESSFRLIEIIKKDDNVIGYFEGTDLRDEVVIICGHYDHLGKRGNNIYYGADDNASGTAAVMELARLFREAKDDGMEFRRTIVFIAFGAEETGLNGSKFYVSNPVFPLENTVVVINMDMIGRSDPPEMVPGYVNVKPMLSLRRPLRRTFKSIDREMDNIEVNTMGLSFSDMRFYFGSDHYSFIKEGVPAVIVNTGMHDDYHKPTDTADKINYSNMTNIVKMVFAVAAKVANEPERYGLGRR